FDVPPEDRVQVAAALASEQRRGVDARKEVAVHGERVGQRGAGADLFVDVVEDGPEGRRGDAALQQVERLDERHAGFQQRRQLLVEDQELAGRDALSLWQAQGDAGNPGLGLQRKDAEAVLFQLVTQAGFAVRDVHAFDNLPVRRRKTAAKLHWNGQ